MTTELGPMPTVDNIAVTGFPAGTIIVIEGRSDYSLINDPSDVVNFTFEDSQVQILIYHPINSSDADYTLNYVVTISTPDAPGVEVPGTFDVLVDAVADKATVNQADADNWDGDAYCLDETNEANFDCQSAGEGDHASKSGKANVVRLPVSATFTDNDGSEFHYFIIEGVPADWSLLTLPTGWELLAVADYPAGYQPSAEGMTYVIRVNYAENDDPINISGTINFDPGEWTNSRDAAGNPHTDAVDDKGNPVGVNGVDLTVKATTWEHDLQDGELTEINNYSETSATYNVSIEENVPEIKGGSILSDETPGVQAAYG